MLILNAEDVRRALPMSVAIEGMKRAFAALSQGNVEMPLRTHLSVEAHQGVSLIMPALVNDGQGESLAVKVVSLFDRNAEKGLARIQAAVMALDPQTGRPMALLEGVTLTAIRTGAASGAGTDLLARKESRTAAIFGAGVQARTQLEAICTVRPIETVWVFDPLAKAAEAFIEAVAGNGPIPQDVRRADTAEQAVAEADIICTATTSHTPVFDDAHLKPGVHINAVGSYQPHVQELPPETVVRCRLFVDSRHAALDETGDLIQPIQQGLIDEDHIQAELGELVLGQHPGRDGNGEITLFKAVGVAVQDAVAARLALQGAEELGLGQSVRW